MFAHNDNLFVKHRNFSIKSHKASQWPRLWRARRRLTADTALNHHALPPPPPPPGLFLVEKHAHTSHLTSHFFSPICLSFNLLSHCLSLQNTIDIVTVNKHSIWFKPKGWERPVRHSGNILWAQHWHMFHHLVSKQFTHPLMQQHYSFIIHLELYVSGQWMYFKSDIHWRSSVFGLLQLLKEISVSLATKCSTICTG